MDFHSIFLFSAFSNILLVFEVPLAGKYHRDAVLIVIIFQTHSQLTLPGV